MPRHFAIFCLMAAVSFCPCVYGLILHPDGEPNLTTWIDRPADAVVGRWSTNASFVVVAPKWVLTTRHQNTNPAQVSIGGVTYNCIYNPDWIGGGPTNNADIRLVRLKNLDGSDPDLTYAPLYTNDNEVAKDIVIGGYGKYRGEPNFSGEDIDGYKWAGTSNDTLRWGQNVVFAAITVTLSSSPYYSSAALSADFDESGEPYEAASAEWDSGGGWFIKVNTGTQGHPNYVWQVAALSAYVERNGVTVFGDKCYGIRISSYETWINGIIDADCPVGDLDSDCKVDSFDLAILADQWLRTNCLTASPLLCDGADFQGNGKANFADFAIFAQNWLGDNSQ